MRKIGSSLVVPAASFALAVLLSLLTGGSFRSLSARQAGGGTGCTCTLKNLTLQTDVTWSTASGSSMVLTSLGVNDTARVCASVRTYGVEAVLVNFNKTLTVKWSGKIGSGQSTGGTQDMTIPFGMEVFLPPCQPGIGSVTAFTDLGGLTQKAHDILLASLQNKYPGKTVTVTITNLQLVDNSVKSQAITSNTCGATGATMTCSPLLWTAGKRHGKASGTATRTTTVGTACP